MWVVVLIVLRFKNSNIYAVRLLNRCFDDYSLDLRISFFWRFISKLFSTFFIYVSRFSFHKFLKTLQEDPDKYIQKLSVEKLSELVEFASYLYSNYDTNLDDNTFDALEYHLKKDFHQQCLIIVQKCYLKQMHFHQ